MCALKWETQSANDRFAASLGGAVYRIVYSGGLHCLRREAPGQPFEWLGQFRDPAQAQAVAQTREDGERRLKAWHRYMMSHDPPADEDWRQ
jgi:hypothetical protein